MKIIRQIWKRKSNGQLLLTIPSDVGIKAGDFVEIRKGEVTISEMMSKSMSEAYSAESEESSSGLSGKDLKLAGLSKTALTVKRFLLITGQKQTGMTILPDLILLDYPKSTSSQEVSLPRHQHSRQAERNHRRKIRPEDLQLAPIILQSQQLHRTSMFQECKATDPAD